MNVKNGLASVLVAATLALTSCENPQSSLPKSRQDLEAQLNKKVWSSVLEFIESDVKNMKKDPYSPFFADKSLSAPASSNPSGRFAQFDNGGVTGIGGYDHGNQWAVSYNKKTDELLVGEDLLGAVIYKRSGDGTVRKSVRGVKDIGDYYYDNVWGYLDSVPCSDAKEMTRYINLLSAVKKKFSDVK